MHLGNIECRLRVSKLSIKILLAESYLQYMSTKRTWTRILEKNVGRPNRGQPKIWGAMAHPGHPPELPLALRSEITVKMFITLEHGIVHRREQWLHPRTTPVGSFYAYLPLRQRRLFPELWRKGQSLSPTWYILSSWLLSFIRWSHIGPGEILAGWKQEQVGEGWYCQTQKAKFSSCHFEKYFFTVFYGSLLHFKNKVLLYEKALPKIFKISLWSSNMQIINKNQKPHDESFQNRTLFSQQRRYALVE